MAKIQAKQQDDSSVVRTDEDLIKLNQQLIKKQEDAEMITKLISIRNNALNAIGMENYVNFARDLIDNCQSFSFTTEIARKYIDQKNPLFNLTLIDPYHADYMKAVSTKNLNPEERKDDFNDYIMEFIQEEITGPLSEKLSRTILEDEDLNRQYEELDTTARRLLSSNLYAVSVSDPRDNKIFLRVLL